MGVCWQIPEAEESTVPSSPVITKVQLQGGRSAGESKEVPLSDNRDSREIVQWPVNWPKELKEDHL